jgi:PTH1 family peptidyl-tRNA hydrolase
MNLSGGAVAPVARRRGIEPEEIVLVYDEADLPLGRIRIRAEGSAGGHNGVQSVLERLGTRQVPRVRLGIGKDEGELADRVLAPFTGAEVKQAAAMVERAADAVEMMAADGLTAAMNKYNREQEA